MPYVPKGERPENKDTKKDIQAAVNDLGARCPKCKGIDTIEANKSGSKRVCINPRCRHRYNVRVS
jgi:Zn ribbon nucleic-acid-binding protein